MQIIPYKEYFNTIHRFKTKLFSFVPGILFPITIGWGVISIVHNKAAVSEPKRTAHLVYTSATGTSLRDTPEKALSPEVVQSMIREKGLFDSRRNASGSGVSHQRLVIPAGFQPGLDGLRALALFDEHREQPARGDPAQFFKTALHHGDATPAPGCAALVV